MNQYEAWMCRMSGRSWWEVMYANGDTLAEWGTLVNTLLTPFGRGASSRWEEIPKRQMTRVRLICPNGQAGELVDPTHDGHHFFQLKVAIRSVGKQRSSVRAHLVGLVRNPDGDSFCYVWEPNPGQLRPFEDNVFHMRYENIGALSLDVQGLRL